MSLNCYWPESLLDDRETIEKYGFFMGTLLMATGMCEITESNLKELQFRAKVFDGTYGGTTPIHELSKWVGLRTNVSQEARRVWLNRIKKGRLHDAEYRARMSGGNIKEAAEKFKKTFAAIVEEAANDQEGIAA